MRRLALLLPLIAFFGVLAPVSSEAAESYPHAVLRYTNYERTSRHLPALKESACLRDRFGTPWARKLAAKRSLSHQSMSPIMTACHGNAVGENVATGNVSPQRLVQMWMASSGHRANILNARYTHIGIGTIRGSDHRVYGVQDFLRAG